MNGALCLRLPPPRLQQAIMTCLVDKFMFVMLLFVLWGCNSRLACSPTVTTADFSLTDGAMTALHKCIHGCAELDMRFMNKETLGLE